MDVLLDEHGIDEAVAEYMRQLIRERLTTKMLEMVDELQLLYSHDSRGGANVFPVRAGTFGRLVLPNIFASTISCCLGCCNVAFATSDIL